MNRTRILKPLTLDRAGATPALSPTPASLLTLVEAMIRSCAEPHARSEQHRDQLPELSRYAALIEPEIDAAACRRLNVSRIALRRSFEQPRLETLPVDGAGERGY